MDDHVERNVYLTMIKKFIAAALAGLLFAAAPAASVFAADGSSEWSSPVVPVKNTPSVSPEKNLELTAKAAVLMNAETGQIVYALNAQEQLPEASITKVMTMLLVFEALDTGRLRMDESVTCSEYAASMGGSQIWLEPGEQMTVHELIKAALVGSANDACVALGEHLAGSNEAFVAMMNDRAEQLGMEHTLYLNCTGLDAPGHVTSAQDIAVVSAELLRHEKVLDYTCIWMDTLRGGALQLTNTNKLIKQYNGAIGLKTGTTSQAGCCIAAAARRDGMTMIAVILGAPNSKSRFADAKKLLDYGFAGWELTDISQMPLELPPIPVTGGLEGQVNAFTQIEGKVLTEKGKGRDVQLKVELPESLEAPVSLGQPIGKVKLLLGSETVGEFDILADRDVPKVTFGAAIRELWRGILRCE